MPPGVSASEPNDGSKLPGMPGLTEAVGMLRAKASPSTANLAVRNTASLALRMAAWCAPDETSAAGGCVVDRDCLAEVGGVRGQSLIRSMENSPLTALLAVPGAIDAAVLDRNRSESPYGASKMTHTVAMVQQAGLGIPSVWTLSRYGFRLTRQARYDLMRRLTDPAREAVLRVPAAAAAEAVRYSARCIEAAEEEMGPRSSDKVRELQASVEATRELLARARHSMLAAFARPSPAAAEAARETLGAVEGSYSVDTGGTVAHSGCCYQYPFPAYSFLVELRHVVRREWLRPALRMLSSVDASADAEWMVPEYEWARLTGSAWFDDDVRQLTSRASWHLARSRNPPYLWM